MTGIRSCVGVVLTCGVMAAGDRFVADGVEENTWYMWEIMGYPCNLVSYYEAETIAESEEGRAMPAFPAQGSCRMIDGVLAVKLSM